MTRTASTASIEQRQIGSCQNYIEHLGRPCARGAVVEFHEHDPESDTTTALPVCRQHGNRLMREAKIVRHRKAWLVDL